MTVPTLSPTLRPPRRLPRASLCAAALIATLAAPAWGLTFDTTSTVPAEVDGIEDACVSREFIVPVSGVTGPLTSISANLGLKAAFAGDVIARVVAPDGTAMALFGRMGQTTLDSFGFGTEFNGNYTFVDPAINDTNIWTAATAAASDDDDDWVIPPGTYATTQVGAPGQSNPAPLTNLLAAFSGLTTAQINGDWTVRVSDCSELYETSVTAVSLDLTGTSNTPRAATPVPTLGEWSLMLLGALAAGLGMRRLRRSSL